MTGAALPLGRLARFATVGVVNTLLSLAIITLALAAGLGDFAANALGYSAGLTLSFLANRRWTFGGSVRISPAEPLGYLASFAIAYCGNLAVLSLCRMAGLANNPVGHIPGMIVYTILFFMLADRFVYKTPDRADHRSGIVLERHWPELALIAVAAATFAALHGIALSHDISWQFWIARQMLAGAELYRDIWEVNPPLWFWSALPVEALAQATGWSSRPILVAIIILMGAGSALLFGFLSGIGSPTRRFVVMAAAFWFCVPMPLFDFGQREQLTIICALPYIAMLASRAERRHVAWPLALAVGGFAAYGFALKHYFIVVPVLLEAWLALRLRREWRPVRPETLVLGACAVLYALAIYIYAPAFLSDMVPMVSATYQGYDEPFIHQIDEPAQLVWLLAGVALFRLRGVSGNEGASLPSAAGLAAVGFILAYFAQQKGWQYHAVPGTAAILLALVVRLSATSPRSWLRYPTGFAAMAVAVGFGILYGSYYDYLRPGSGAILGSLKRGDSVAALATDPMWIWPIAEEDGLNWSLSLYSHWMLPAIAYDDVHHLHDPAVARATARLRERTLADLQCNPPAVLMVETIRRYEMQPDGFDILDFFRRDPALRAFLASHYVEMPRTKYFRILRRTGHVASSGGDGCRRPMPLGYSLPRAIR